MDLEEEDFVIKVHPHRDTNNRWTGSVTLGIITSKENPLTDDDYFYMMEFTNLICACVPVMQDDPSIRETLEEFVEEERRQEDMNSSSKDKIKNRKDNVISVSFTSDTDGSA